MTEKQIDSFARKVYDDMYGVHESIEGVDPQKEFYINRFKDTLREVLEETKNEV